jgi:hypothetical protein
VIKIQGGPPIAKSKRNRKNNFWDSIQKHLHKQGIDIQTICEEIGEDLADFKMVCVVPDLTESVEELGKSTRDQVVMV